MIETSCKVCGIRYADATTWAPGDWRYRTCPSCREWAWRFGRIVAADEAARRLVQSYRAAYSFDASLDDATREVIGLAPRPDWARHDYVPAFAEPISPGDPGEELET